MSVLDEQVLKLNKGWQPIDTCSVEAAFGHIAAETARFVGENPDDPTNVYTLHDFESWCKLPIREGDLVVGDYLRRIRVPEIIVCSTQVNVTREKVTYSKRNLVKRDGGCCQYCGKSLRPKEQTVEHVVPRRRGGVSSWTNCVLACLDCNARKKDKAPEEVGMKLIVRPEMKAKYPKNPRLWTAPYEPAWSPIFRLSSGRIKDSWKHYLHV